MIKPIVYHSIEEKEALERALIASIPNSKKVSTSKALMTIFSRQREKLLASKTKSKTKAK
jgi:hypothetical protein